MKAGWLRHNQLKLLGRFECVYTVRVKCTNDENKMLSYRRETALQGAL